jgi:hypothetical protein
VGRALRASVFTVGLLGLGTSAPGLAQPPGDSRTPALFQAVSEAELPAPALKHLGKLRRPELYKRVTVARLAPPREAAQLLRSGFDLRLGAGRYRVTVEGTERSRRADARERFSSYGKVARLDPDAATAGPGNAVFTYAPQRLYGRIETGTATFTITPLGDGFHLIGEVDFTGLRNEHPRTAGADRPFEPPERPRPPIPPLREPPPPLPPLPPPLPPAHHGQVLRDAGTGSCISGTSWLVSTLPFLWPEISLGVVFSPGTSEILTEPPSGNPDEQWLYAEHLAANINDSFRTSGVYATVVVNDVTYLTGPGAIDDSSTTIQQVLADIRGSTSLGTTVRQWRNDIGADIVVALVATEEFYYGMSPSRNDVLQAANAYSVVRIQYATAWLTFSHEVGHHFGAGHDLEADGYVPDYARGYKNMCAYRTIMAYSTGCAGEIQRFNRWSNCRHPGIRSWLVMGDDTHNNARMINENAASVASFR